MQKNKKILYIILIILVTIICISLFVMTARLIYSVANSAYNFIKARIDNINYVEIDKNDLGIETSEDEIKIYGEEFEDIITIALFGSDSRDVNDMYAGRSDSIIIASLNPKLKTIKLMSIPRDTYVNVPGYGWTKINHAYAYGGEQLLLKTINSNFDLNINEYITVDFLGMVNLINKIGGINLEISEDEKNIINRYLHEIYRLEGLPYTEMNEVGNVILNGEQALAHCRNRYVGSDFVRARRQRDVIIASINKISSFEPKESLSYIDFALSQIKTNVNIKSYIPQIADVIFNLDSYKSNIISVQIPSLEYGYDNYINGTYYFVVDLNRAVQDFKSYIYEK